MPIDKLSKRDRDNRRQKSRFPINRELRYKLLQDGRTLEAGLGQTLNMGSGGVAFTLDRELAAGASVELSISWPVLLESGTPMRLVVFGKVLRSGGSVSVCTIDKYEFRTQARAPQSNTGSRGDTALAPWRGRLSTKQPVKFGTVAAPNYGNALGYR
jgi:hypothetical protein